jgi:hypothetical protein
MLQKEREERSITYTTATSGAFWEVVLKNRGVMHVQDAMPAFLKNHFLAGEGSM